MEFIARKWQSKAFKTVDKTIGSSAKQIIPVNACVGSGKTSVACYAFGKFIVSNRDKHSVQMLVTPRIRLCDQQNKEIASFLLDAFGLKEGMDYSIVGVDCTKREFNVKNDHLESRHTVFVICDESLWGISNSVDPAARWHGWLRKFARWSSSGFVFGFCALDEAHNYENNEKLIFSKDDEACLMSFFNVMPMSGTPAAFQREWSSRWKNNVCSCSPHEAMENGWICKPTLNLVIGDRETGWAKAVAAVLNREVALCKNEVFKSRLMVNCSGIDDIKHLVSLLWIKKHAGKDFHIITLHSTKGYSDDNGLLAFAKPTIDCKDVDADEAYRAIEMIDNGEYFSDNLPIIVAQVQMLGEGINVSSFNSILTASNADKTAMQQIGRCIRNYKADGKDKVTNGHANVYVLTDNVQSVKNLLLNLEQYDLTDECFSWGDKIDIMTGSGIDDDNNTAIPELNGVNWDPIDPMHDLEIIEMMQTMKSKLYKKASVEMYNDFFKDNDGNGRADIEELEELLESLSKSGVMKLWSNHTFSKDEMRAARQKHTNEKCIQHSKNAGDENKKQSKATNFSFDVLMKWLFDIRHSLKTSKSIKELWKIDRQLSIETILKNSAVAEFLVKHIGEAKLNRYMR